MPRRRALTEAQLESLLALPAAKPDLIRHWTLGAADLAAIERRRGSAQSARLRFAALRLPLSRPSAPTRRADPGAGAALRRRAAPCRPGGAAVLRRPAPDPARATRRRCATTFGFRMFAPGHGREILAWLLPVALATTNALAVAATLMDELRRRRIMAPGPSVDRTPGRRRAGHGRAARRRPAHPRTVARTGRSARCVASAQGGTR